MTVGNRRGLLVPNTCTDLELQVDRVAARAAVAAPVEAAYFFSLFFLTLETPCADDFFFFFFLCSTAPTQLSSRRSGPAARRGKTVGTWVCSQPLLVFWGGWLVHPCPLSRAAGLSGELFPGGSSEALRAVVSPHLVFAMLALAACMCGGGLIRNVVACNDHVALVHTDLDRETEDIIADVLGVEVR